MDINDLLHTAYYVKDTVHPTAFGIKVMSHVTRMGMLTPDEQEFEREISRSVVREVAKILGYGHVPFVEDEKFGGTLPFIIRVFGECLVIPGLADTRLSVTYWQGNFNLDVVVRKRSAKPHNNLFYREGSAPADDPQVFEKIADFCREALEVCKSLSIS